MPTVKVTISKKFDSAKKEELALKILNATATATGKPIGVTQAILDDGKTIIFGGDADVHTAFIAVMSIGGLTHDVCERLSAFYCAILSKEGIDPKKIYICFNEKRASEWGCDSKLFG